MIEVGDTVKVIGTTTGMESPAVELIPIGTVCTVKLVQDSAIGKVVLIRAESGTRPYWYPVSSVEKGHLEWVKDEERVDEQGKPWLISGAGLPTVEITALSFDIALELARRIDSRYTTGQLKEGTRWPHLH